MLLEAAMRPSEALEQKREAIRELVPRFRAANPRVFGSVLHGAIDHGENIIDVLGDRHAHAFHSQFFEREELGEGEDHRSGPARTRHTWRNQTSVRPVPAVRSCSAMVSRRSALEAAQRRSTSRTAHTLTSLIQSTPNAGVAGKGT